LVCTQDSRQSLLCIDIDIDIDIDILEWAAYETELLILFHKPA